MLLCILSSNVVRLCFNDILSLINHLTNTAHMQRTFPHHYALSPKTQDCKAQAHWKRVLPPLSCAMPATLDSLLAPCCLLYLYVFNDTVQ